MPCPLILSALPASHGELLLCSKDLAGCHLFQEALLDIPAKHPSRHSSECILTAAPRDAKKALLYCPIRQVRELSPKDKLSSEAEQTLEQGFPTFLMIRPFNTVLHVGVIPQP